MTLSIPNQIQQAIIVAAFAWQATLLIFNLLKGLIFDLWKEGLEGFMDSLFYITIYSALLCHIFRHWH